MKTHNQSFERNRGEIVAEMNSVSRAVSGKITEKRRKLKSGKVVVYHQLQQWVDGRNVTTHIPESCVQDFREAVEGHGKLQTLVSELSVVDTKSLAENGEFKKKRRKYSEDTRLK